MGWFSTVLRVVNTASGLLMNKSTGLTDEEVGGDEVTTTIGGLTFVRNIKTQKSSVQTKDQKEYYIFFSRLGKNNVLQCRTIITKDNVKSTDLDNALERYSDGYITYLPVTVNNGEHFIAFTAQYIFQKDTKFSDDKSGNTYQLSYGLEKGQGIFRFNSKNEFLSFRMSFTDRNGINLSVSDTHIDKNLDVYSAKTILPEGCDQNLPYEDVRIEIKIPVDHLNALKKRLWENKE